VLLPLEIVEPHRSQFKQKRKEYEARAIELLGKVGLAGYERKFPGSCPAACSSAPASAAR
jgi:NitT/TauT family transport system ATP-binding protein